MTAGAGVPWFVSVELASTEACESELLIFAMATRAACSLVMFSVVSVTCVNACLKSAVARPSTSSSTPNEITSSMTVMPRYVFFFIIIPRLDQMGSGVAVGTGVGVGTGVFVGVGVGFGVAVGIGVAVLIGVGVGDGFTVGDGVGVGVGVAGVSCVGV